MSTYPSLSALRRSSFSRLVRQKKTKLRPAWTTWVRTAWKHIDRRGCFQQCHNCQHRHLWLFAFTLTCKGQFLLILSLGFKSSGKRKTFESLDLANTKKLKWLNKVPPRPQRGWSDHSRRGTRSPQATSRRTAPCGASWPVEYNRLVLRDPMKSFFQVHPDQTNRFPII